MDDNISRVDIFSIEGKLYVNEFENLQAQFLKMGKSLEENLTSKLSDFYRNLLDVMIKDRDQVPDVSNEILRKISF